ncbi:MAG: SBBP repeat-containing protein [Planctomycetes bacterium]|nr:SBBP repeat-containing protein [Planctomycetota bacterium]
MASIPRDFGPWGGSVTFTTNSAVKWHFGRTTDGLDPDENDFYSVAMHEVVHLLGFGLAESWGEFVDPVNGTFAGPASLFEYDQSGNVPLDPSHGHWQAGTKDGAVETAMDPDLTRGTRKLMTDLDFAGLDDLGWEIFSKSGRGWATLAGQTGTTPDDGGTAVTVDVLGNVYVTGSVFVAGDPGNNKGVGDVFIAKYSATGQEIWKHQFGGPGDQRGQDIAVDSKGNVYVIGSFTDTLNFEPGSTVGPLTSAGNYDVFVLKIKPSGEYAWAKRFGQSGSVWDWVGGIEDAHHDRFHRLDRRSEIRPEFTGSEHTSGILSRCDTIHSIIRGRKPEPLTSDRGRRSDSFWSPSPAQVRVVDDRGIGARLGDRAGALVRIFHPVVRTLEHAASQYASQKGEEYGCEGVKHQAEIHRMDPRELNVKVPDELWNEEFLVCRMPVQRAAEDDDKKIHPTNQRESQPKEPVVIASQFSTIQRQD